MRNVTMEMLPTRIAAPQTVASHVAVTGSSKTQLKNATTTMCLRKTVAPTVVDELDAATPFYRLELKVAMTAT